MWIKNYIDEENSSFISIQNIDLKNMNAKNIKILMLNEKYDIFLKAKKGKIEKNNFLLEEVNYYDVKNEFYKRYDTLI